MGRWEPNAQGRLLKAAMELYADQGFERATVAEIAERAGLSERTFFRHFADKREVLFAGIPELRSLLVASVLDAPASLDPLAIVQRALHATCAFFGDQPDFSRRRQQIINSSTELQERELIKLASLSLAIANALMARGVSELQSSLAAGAGISAFRLSFDRWIVGSAGATLASIIDEVFQELRVLATDT